MTDHHPNPNPNPKGKVFRFSNEQYTNMSTYFTKYEQDGDGELNLKELSNLVREVAGLTDPPEIKDKTEKLMAKLDISGNKKLSFNEFLKGYEKMLSQAAAQSSGLGSSIDMKEDLKELDILKVTSIPEKKPDPKHESKVVELEKKVKELEVETKQKQEIVIKLERTVADLREHFEKLSKQNEEDQRKWKREKELLQLEHQKAREGLQEEVKKLQEQKVYVHEKLDEEKKKNDFEIRNYF